MLAIPDRCRIGGTAKNTLAHARSTDIGHSTPGNASARLPVQTVAMPKTYKLGPSRRTVNAIMAPLVRLGIGGRSTYLLTTTGRKTGQPRTTPVILVENDAERWLVAPYGPVAWVYNVRAQPRLLCATADGRKRFMLKRSTLLQRVRSFSVTFTARG